MLEAINIEKSFTSGSRTQRVLNGISFTIDNGEFVSIVGRSGAGKSTLLYQLGLLDRPTSGEVIVNNVKTSTLTDSQRGAFRLQNYGFVFQDYALLPELSALENVMLPLLMRAVGRKQAIDRAIGVLQTMDLAERLHNLPSQLSGGEQQRVSIARAIVDEPAILFADEPTASLDRDTAREVMSAFTAVHNNGQTIIMITHEQEDASLAQRIITLDDGLVVSVDE